MLEAFRDGGYMMWPILICGALIVGLGMTSAMKLVREQDGSVADARSGMDAILFWGSFAVVLGVLGTTVGVMQAAKALEVAGDVPSALVWGGLRISLITTVFGLLILTIALLAWFGLWVRYRRALRTRTA